MCLFCRFIKHLLCARPGTRSLQGGEHRWEAHGGLYEPTEGPVLAFSVSEDIKCFLIFRETFLPFTSLGRATTKAKKQNRI